MSRNIQIREPENNYEDVLHPETNSGMVLMENGSTLQEDLDAHKADYEYQIPTIVGTQIQLEKQSDTAILKFKLATDLSGGAITISTDEGDTDKPLVDIEGVAVTGLDQGFVEVVENAVNFTHAPKGSKINAPRADFELESENDIKAGDLVRLDYGKASPANANYNDGVLILDNIPLAYNYIAAEWINATSAILIYREEPNTLAVIATIQDGEVSYSTPLVIDTGVDTYASSILCDINKLDTYKFLVAFTSPYLYTSDYGYYNKLYGVVLTASENTITKGTTVTIQASSQQRIMTPVFLEILTPTSAAIFLKGYENRVGAYALTINGTTITFGSKNSNSYSNTLAAMRLTDTTGIVISRNTKTNTLVCQTFSASTTYVQISVEVSIAADIHSIANLVKVNSEKVLIILAGTPAKVIPIAISGTTATVGSSTNLNLSHVSRVLYAKEIDVNTFLVLISLTNLYEGFCTAILKTELTTPYFTNIHTLGDNSMATTNLFRMVENVSFDGFTFLSEQGVDPFLTVGIPYRRVDGAALQRGSNGDTKVFYDWRK